MEKAQSQRNCVKKHLMEYGSITSMEAWDKYHITRLSSIIHRLRKTMNIVTEDEGTYGRYRLEKADG